MTLAPWRFQQCLRSPSEAATAPHAICKKKKRSRRQNVNWKRTGFAMSLAEGVPFESVPAARISFASRDLSAVVFCPRHSAVHSSLSHPGFCLSQPPGREFGMDGRIIRASVGNPCHGNTLARHSTSPRGDVPRWPVWPAWVTHAMVTH